MIYFALHLFVLKNSQLLNITILKFSNPVLLKQLDNVFPYCPAVGGIGRVNFSNIDIEQGQCWSCNWECLYCDSSRDVQWNIAWALGKSLELRPWDFLRLRSYFIVYPSSHHNTGTRLNIGALSNIFSTLFNIQYCTLSELKETGEMYRRVQGGAL